MTGEEWARLEALFDEARQRPPAGREAWLATACPDPALREQVRDMLAAFDDDPDFLESTTDIAGAVAHAVASALEGQRLGPYRVTRQVGQGGMGIVYEAVRDDDDFARRVAIKVLPAWSGTAANDRFRRERRLLAGLDHPGIARLIDSGATPGGTPYFVMEYVEGRPIDAWCREQSLSLGDRVALVERVCEAVAYAHQRLVVHRDIKPANILVTPEGRPKLLDFGVATVLSTAGDTAGLTRTGQQSFTPEFSSPEQIRGEPVTTASDVYSLGLLLYLLTSGQRPYRLQGLSPLDVMRVVCEQDPPAPSGVAGRRDRQAIAGPLDAVILRALRKAPQDRYPTVAALQADLAAWRQGLPVSAAPDPLSRRVRRFTRRHRVAVGAAAAVVVALAAGGGIAVQQARVAGQERAKAEARFNDVRSLANTVVGPLYDAIADLPGSTKARQLLVTEALAYLDRLAAQSAGDPGLQRELAQAYQRIGDVQGNPYGSNLGDRRAAMASYRRALDIREALAAADGATVEDRRALASALDTAGDLLWADGDFDATLAHYSRALAIVEALTAERPGDAELSFDLNRSHYSLGQALTKLGRFPEARRHYAAAAAMARVPAVASQFGDAALRAAAVDWLKLGDCELRDGKVDDALALYRRSADTLASIEQGTGVRRTRAFVIQRIAMAEAIAGRLTLADRAVGEAHALQVSLLAADPADRQMQADAALLTSTRGGLALARGQVERARALLAESEAALVALTNAGADFADLRSDRAMNLRMLGDAEAAAGDRAAAARAYDEAISLLDRHPRDAEYGSERALAYLRASRVGTDPARARRQREEAVAELDRLAASGVRVWFGDLSAPGELAREMSAAREGR
jgi:non-specific serine/threonine protein kinase/serine/threonine-protein kinase